MRIHIQQKELRKIAEHCNTECDECRYCRICRVIDASGATMKTAYRWEKKDIKSIAEYLKSEHYE